MNSSDIWHKYHEWYFEIGIRNFTSRLASEIWDSFEISQVVFIGIYAEYHVQIMLLFVYTTTHKRFVIFPCRYFKLSWNITALSQSNCRNFSCSSIKYETFESCLLEIFSSSTNLIQIAWFSLTRRTELESHLRGKVKSDNTTDYCLRLVHRSDLIFTVLDYQNWRMEELLLMVLDHSRLGLENK